jgi:hypothetical protein
MKNMKKQAYVLATVTLVVVAAFTQSASAATMTFYANGSDADAPVFLSKFPGQGPGQTHKNVSIDYALGTDWTINSATFWIKAVDDWNDLQSPDEQARVTKIEDIDGNYGETEIDGYGWYFGLDVLDYLLNSHTTPFTATINAQKGDFRYQNAKIDIDYTVNPPSQVPVPAAIWLFGSAMVGLAGFSRRKAGGTNATV